MISCDSSFIPPFCPNPECIHHQHPRPPTGKSWFVRKGYFATRQHPRMPRFYCPSCELSFCARSFSVDYRLRLPIPCHRVLPSLFTCQGIRQLARVLKVNPQSVARRQSRLGAQALGLHARFLRDATPEPEIVLDGLESFTHSQYFPNNIHLLAGKKSGAVWGWNIVFLKRKGRMTEKQKHRREEIERIMKIPKGMTAQRAAELLREYGQVAQKRGLGRLELFSDRHRAYPQAIEQAGLTGMITHHQVSSELPRTVHHPLFVVNYLERQVRKDMSEFVRETTRMAQRPQRQLERVAVYAAYHNCHKPYRETGEQRFSTHAEKAGLSAEWARREWERLKSERVFPHREPLREFHRRVWNRQDEIPRKDPKVEVLRCTSFLGRIPA